MPTHSAHNWQGQAHVEMTDTRMEGMNFQQMIQQAVERNGGDVKAAENFDNVTRLDRFTTDLTLNDGVVTLNDMQWSIGPCWRFPGLVR